MLPRVVLHNVVSVDGRMDWISPDVGQYYELAGRWNPDAILTGADTMLDAPEEAPEEGANGFERSTKDPGDRRPLLAVVDSRGRLRSWHFLQVQPYWRDAIALCSGSTPKEYLDYLRERHVDYVVAGEGHVDMRAALEELNARYGVKLVRVDSGGTLNGLLLRARLVHEVSVLIHPSLVGGTTPRSLFRAPDLISPEGVIPVRLTHVERMKDDTVWLRYEVTR